MSKLPACTVAGLETATCKNCGEVKSQTIPATGHNWGKWETVKECNCLQDGERNRYCKVCGEKDFTYMFGGEHTWDPSYWISMPTCAQYGELEKECKLCGFKQPMALVCVRLFQSLYGFVGSSRNANGAAADSCASATAPFGCCDT